MRDCLQATASKCVHLRCTSLPHKDGLTLACLKFKSVSNPHVLPQVNQRCSEEDGHRLRRPKRVLTCMLLKSHIQAPMCEHRLIAARITLYDGGTFGSRVTQQGSGVLWEWLTIGLGCETLQDHRMCAAGLREQVTHCGRLPRSNLWYLWLMRRVYPAVLCTKNLKQPVQSLVALKPCQPMSVLVYHYQVAAASALQSVARQLYGDFLLIAASLAIWRRERPRRPATAL